MWAHHIVHGMYVMATHAVPPAMTHHRPKGTVGEEGQCLRCDDTDNESDEYVTKLESGFHFCLFGPLTDLDT